MVKVKFFYKSGTEEFNSEIMDFPIKPNVGEIVQIEGFFKNSSSLKDSGIHPSAEFKIIKLVWKNESNTSVYLEATLKAPTKKNYV